MTTENTFQGTTYTTRANMLTAIAHECYLTMWSPAQVKELFSDVDPAETAAECVHGWDLGGMTIDELAPHMADALAAIIAEADAETA